MTQMIPPLVTEKLNVVAAAIEAAAAASAKLFSERGRGRLYGGDIVGECWYK